MDILILASMKLAKNITPSMKKQKMTTTLYASNFLWKMSQARMIHFPFTTNSDPFWQAKNLTSSIKMLSTKTQLSTGWTFESRAINKTHPPSTSSSSQNHLSSIYASRNYEGCCSSDFVHQFLHMHRHFRDRWLGDESNHW